MLQLKMTPYLSCAHASWGLMHSPTSWSNSQHNLGNPTSTELYHFHLQLWTQTFIKDIIKTNEHNTRNTLQTQKDNHATIENDAIPFLCNRGAGTKALTKLEQITNNPLTLQLN